MKNIDRPKHEADKRDAMNSQELAKYSGWPPPSATEDKPRRKQRDEKPAEEAGE